MGKVVNQGFDKKAVFDVDSFIFPDRDLKILKKKDISFLLQFVTPMSLLYSSEFVTRHLPKK